MPTVFLSCFFFFILTDYFRFSFPFFLFCADFTISWFIFFLSHYFAFSFLCLLFSPHVFPDYQIISFFSFPFCSSAQTLLFRDLYIFFHYFVFPLLCLLNSSFPDRYFFLIYKVMLNPSLPSLPGSPLPYTGLFFYLTCVSSPSSTSHVPLLIYHSSTPTINITYIYSPVDLPSRAYL